MSFTAWNIGDLLIKEQLRGIGHRSESVAPSDYRLTMKAPGQSNFDTAMFGSPVRCCSALTLKDDFRRNLGLPSVGSIAEGEACKMTHEKKLRQSFTPSSLAPPLCCPRRLHVAMVPEMCNEIRISSTVHICWLYFNPIGLIEVFLTRKDTFIMGP